jgi:hypothetical protein
MSDLTILADGAPARQSPAPPPPAAAGCRILRSRALAVRLDVLSRARSLASLASGGPEP